MKESMAWLCGCVPLTTCSSAKYRVGDGLLCDDSAGTPPSNERRLHQRSIGAPVACGTKQQKDDRLTMTVWTGWFLLFIIEFPVISYQSSIIIQSISKAIIIYYIHNIYLSWKTGELEDEILLLYCFISTTAILLLLHERTLTIIMSEWIATFFGDIFLLFNVRNNTTTNNNVIYDWWNLANK